MSTEDWIPGKCEQYHRDTTYLLDWLSKTAVRCGYDWKSKSRATNRYEFSSREIEFQLHLIASNRNPRIVVPSRVLTATKDAIESRKKLWEYYSQLPLQDDSSDEGHWRFILTLKSILVVLESLPGERPSCSSVKEGTELKQKDKLNQKEEVKKPGQVLENMSAKEKRSSAPPSQTPTSDTILSHQPGQKHQPHLILLWGLSAFGSCNKLISCQFLTRIDGSCIVNDTQLPVTDVRGCMCSSTRSNIGSNDLCQYGYHTKTLTGRFSHEIFKGTMGSLPAFITDGDWRALSETLSTRDDTGLPERTNLCLGAIKFSLVIGFEMIGSKFEQCVAPVMLVAHSQQASSSSDQVEVASIPELHDFIQRHGSCSDETPTPKTFKASCGYFLLFLNAIYSLISEDPHSPQKQLHPTSSSRVQSTMTFYSFAQHKHDKSSMRTILSQLLAQSEHCNVCLGSNLQSKQLHLAALLRLALQHLSSQLSETADVDYWYLANNCLHVLLLRRIQATLNSDQTCKTQAKSSDDIPLACLGVFLAMAATIRQGVMETIKDRPLIDGFNEASICRRQNHPQ